MIKQNSKIHAIILARGNSKGIKLKNLVNVNNRPLIYWTIRDCLKSSRIKHIWVSTDNKKIGSYAKKLGAKIIWRPENLALDNSLSEDGWLHAINEIEKIVSIENAMFLQATSPLRGYRDINQSINYFFKNNLDSLFSSCVVLNHYNWEMRKNSIKPLYDIHERPMRQKIQQLLTENGSFYIVKTKKFKKFKTRVFGNIGSFKQDFYKGFEIDEKKDINFLANILKIYKNKL